MRLPSLPVRTITVGFAFLSSLLGCSGQPEASAEETLGAQGQAALATRVVGYFPTWNGNVADIQFDKLTHVNYSFVVPTAQGGLTGPGSGDSRLKSLVTAAHAKGVKVLIAVGGWNNGDDSAFEQLAANATARNTFVNNLVNYVTQAGLDGVDIDWEYPDPGTSAQNYATLMKQLGTAMHSRGKLLTAAVVANSYTGGGVPTATFADIDFLNIMAYDGGQPHSTYTYAVQSLDYWLGRGLPKDKAVLGVPFYGRSPSSYVGYAALVARDSQAPYKDNVGDVYYNGIATIQSKTTLALQRAGGVMIWDISDDAKGSASLLTAIAQKAQGGTTQPPTGQNLLANEGFESGLTSWNSEWHNSVLAHKVDTDFPYTGASKLTHYASAAYQQVSGQSKSLANGTYRASVWARSSGGQNALRLYAKNHGGAEVTAEIGSGAVSAWTKYTISNIPVTSGAIEVGVYSDAQAQNWAAFDQFELVAQ
ncbi:glycosyl hydrolase family 18 protein [Archangium primigenium]|uniref:glycosyl hydrolase family 18 protein n=1 Tax=[Archangium] primigenium TaxID=2792470 RepID=UPI00195AE139|nr:glycosyl hydrolase family 18 protein [Archangium primigenium]MBM7116001.1 chitinase [Archangium primigenium]